VNTITRIDPRTIAANFSENDPLADGLGAGLHRLLLRRFDGTLFADRLVSAEDVIWSLRGRKLPMEVDVLRKCVVETERILAAAAEKIRPGLTGVELAQTIRGLAEEKGYGCAWSAKICPIVTTGPDSRVGHVSPTAEQIGPGSLVHVDYGIKHQGYCSDIQRMWWVGANGDGVPEPVQHAFDTIVEAIRKSAQALKPGVTGWEIDQVARDVLEGRGYEGYQHALGHQLGRSAHDGGGATLAPRWERYNETPFRPVEAGNVFTLEPSILLTEYGIVALEENVLVTENGCEFLSNPQTELPVLTFA
jgi:Xaa-Pro aminopeptidase